MLRDPETGEHIEIIGGLKKHPIEMKYEDKMDKSKVTVVTAMNEQEDLWQKEIDRIYQRLD